MNEFKKINWNRMYLLVLIILILDLVLLWIMTTRYPE
jgi:hypothetical protein